MWRIRIEIKIYSDWLSRMLFVFITLVIALSTWYLRPFLVSGVYPGANYDWTTTVAQTFSPVSDFHSMRQKDSVAYLDNSKRIFPIIDILSTGSIYRLKHHVVQEAFFREHPSVRHFFKASEIHDTEVDCNSQLNISHIQIVSFVARKK